MKINSGHERQGHGSIAAAKSVRLGSTPLRTDGQGEGGGGDALPFRAKSERPSGRIIRVESITTPSGDARYAIGATQLGIERHSRIRSTSLSVISSFVRS
jgi:hypothetical protein